jgi:predicted Na+-dependent transporter
MTDEAGGNVAMSVLLSAGTNVAAVATVPLWLDAIIAVQSSSGPAVEDDATTAGNSNSGHFNPWDLLWKLALTILVPLAAGKALQFSARVTVFARTHKGALKLVSFALLIAVPWITMSQSAEKLRQAKAVQVGWFSASRGRLHRMAPRPPPLWSALHWLCAHCRMHTRSLSLQAWALLYTPSSWQPTMERAS